MTVTPKWLAIVSLIASGGLATVVQALGAALPKQQALIANIAAIVVAVAGFVVLAFSPASKVVADAPITDSSGKPTGAVNVSTTTTLPIQAPAPPKT